MVINYIVFYLMKRVSIFGFLNIGLGVFFLLVFFLDILEKYVIFIIIVSIGFLWILYG